MTLDAGSRLGPYEITSRLGAGGMGEVYQALDTRLDRSVAIKVLPSELAHNDQLQQRFEREAKTISQLNHPNICTLYDVGHEKGVAYLVMELLDGETLADRIARGPLPLADVVRYGSQIAQGLSRAHRAGIVHRDLKPGNIMITKSGAKLLDFGLAKSAVIEINPDGATQQKPLTREGTILGTFQYMAPEQLEGTEADARTDIFAFGAVLYEMVTGKRAFAGKTKTSLIAAIVGGEPPPITALQPLAPTSLEHVITKCLKKDPDDRWQSAHDLGEELKWAGTATDSVASRPVRWFWPALALLTIVALAATGLLLRERSRTPEAFSFAIMPPRGYSIIEPAISPDGRAVVFTATDRSGDRSLWIRHNDAVDPVRLTEKSAGSKPAKPFWSADGKWIGFFDNKKLMKISANGGRPEIISSDAGYGVGASWSRSGTILIARRFNEGLFRVPASGGEPVKVTDLDTAHRETLHGWPQFLDDGDHFLFLRRTISEQKNEIHAGSVSQSLNKLLLKADALVGVSLGHLLFVRDGAIYAQPFDQKKLELSGEPRKVVDDVVYSEEWSHSWSTVSANGAMAHLPASNETATVEVGWYDRNGRLIEKLFNATSLRSATPSPDERKLALLKFDPRKGAYDVYARDLARGVETRLTGGLSNNQWANWSPSGDRVFFSSDRDGMYDIYSVPDDGASAPSTISKTSDDKNVSGLSPDGRFLLMDRDGGKPWNDVWVLPMTGGGPPRLLVATDGTDGGARFSPDGKAIVYSSDVSGRLEVYVRPFPDGRSTQVSTEGGAGPEWSADGKSVVFESPSRQLVSVPIGAGLQPGMPLVLFRRPETMFSWSLGTRSDRILGCSLANPSEAISVVHYRSRWNERK